MSLNRKSRLAIALFWVVREELVFPSAYCADPVEQQHNSDKGVRLMAALLGIKSSRQRDSASFQWYPGRWHF
jgi:hypothetical protein